MVRAFDAFMPAQLDPYGERFKQSAALSTAKQVVPGICVRSVLGLRRLSAQHSFPEQPQLNDIFVNLDDDQTHIYTEYTGGYQWVVVAGYPTNSAWPRQYNG